MRRKTALKKQEKVFPVRRGSMLLLQLPSIQKTPPFLSRCVVNRSHRLLESKREAKFTWDKLAILLKKSA